QNLLTPWCPREGKRVLPSGQNPIRHLPACILPRISRRLIPLFSPRLATEPSATASAKRKSRRSTCGRYLVLLRFPLRRISALYQAGYGGGLPAVRTGAQPGIGRRLYDARGLLSGSVRPAQGHPAIPIRL